MLDYNTRILSSNGLNIRLSMKQADLFNYLWSKNNRKANRDEIMTALYGNSGAYQPQIRIIKVHARRLRLKMAGTLYSIKCNTTGKLEREYCLVEGNK